jgi:hypothetical protein
MYRISETKMINPAHIVSIDYESSPDGSEGVVKIQMSNQSRAGVYQIEGGCDQCEKILNDLINIVADINGGGLDYYDEFNMPFSNN